MRVPGECVVPISEQFLHFAEGGIHDSVGVGVGPTWAWLNPGADSRFRVEDAMHLHRVGGPHESAWREPPLGVGGHARPHF